MEVSDLRADALGLELLCLSFDQNLSEKVFQGIVKIYFMYHG